MQHLAAINRLIGQPNGAERHYLDLLVAAGSFHSTFQDPSNAVFPNPHQADELRPILSALSNTSSMEADLEVLLSKVLKILLRKEANRKGMGRLGMQMLVSALERQTRCQTLAAAELGNVVINTCYNGDANVRIFIECNGLPPLFVLLRSRDVNITQSVLGALQGICYVPYGRQFVRENFGTVQLMAHHLSSPDPDIRARAIGCLHNLSADAVSLTLLREAGCLPPVVEMLKDSSPELCRAAAGIIQNTAREEGARLILEKEGATSLLLNLLTSSDVECQASSVGAILNMVGPSLNQEQMTELRRALSDGIVMGAINSCLFDPTPLPP